MLKKNVIQEEEEQKQYTSLVDMQDDIDVLWEQGEKIDRRKKRIFQEWKNKWNLLVSEYNEKAGFKCYSKIKK